MSSIRVTNEDPRAEVAAALVAELSAELGPLYPDRHGGSGSGGFKPEDVLMERAVFVVVWDGDEAVGCGALRPMEDAKVGEVKRMFVRPAARGKGYSRVILLALEERARGFSYEKLILETGTLQIAAMGLYETAGYKRMECYGSYVDEPLSVCYEKSLVDGVN